MRILWILALTIGCGTIDDDNDGFDVDQDCDDKNAEVYPGAIDDSVDGTDQDCDDFDGPDADQDGFADKAAGGEDCDDTNAQAHPSATDESVDGTDQDCDGLDGPDADMDGYADKAAGGDDCNDANADVHPGATEICDDVDDDCDGDLSEDFPDLDRDGVIDCLDDVVCAPEPADTLSWFRGEDDAVDSADGLVVTQHGGVTFADGLVGRGVDFSDASYGVTIADPEPFLGEGSRSVEAWIKLDAPSSSIVAHYECGSRCSSGGISSPSTFIFALDPDGFLVLSVRDANTKRGELGAAVRGDQNLADGAWHHVAGVMDVPNLALRIYVDGALHATTETTADKLEGLAQDGDSDDDPLTIGYQEAANTGAPVNVASGMIDELSLYASAVSDDAIDTIAAVREGGKCR